MIENAYTRRPNRLFRVMAVLSLLIHGVVLIQVAGIYRRSSPSVIELSMAVEPLFSERTIPRPRIRHLPPDAVRLPDPGKSVPRFDIPPEDTAASKEIVESTAVPPMSDLKADTVSGVWSGAPGGFFSKKDYYDMIRMKIESSRVYPETARSRMIEGRVTVRFTVTEDGQVSSVSVVKGSGSRILDQAALRAVADAAPFPRPPAGMFTGPVPVQITVSFELT
jgi:protein TonB